MIWQKPKKEWYKRWWAITIFVLIGLSIGGSLVPDDNSSPTDIPTQTNTQQPNEEITQTQQENSEPEETTKELTNEGYIAEISTIYQSMMDISESTSGTINALSSGMIDLNDFQKRVDKLWYQSYQNSESLKEISPSENCEDAHHYLKEASAGLFLVLDELSKYSDDYKESHINKANSYMESTRTNVNKFGEELETNCK